MNFYKKLATVIFVQTLLTSSGAIADPGDKCNDILVDGTLEKANLKTNDYLQYVMLYRMTKMNQQQAASDKSLAASGAIGPYSGAAQSNAREFQMRTESLSKQFDQSLTISQQKDIAVASGDPIIVKAWSDCMKKQGGLGVRFIPNDKNSVFMIVQWFTPPGSGQNSVELIEDVRLPSGIVIDKSDIGYLKKGTEISNEGARVAHLYLENGRSTATIIVRAVDRQRAVQDAYAFLPPRVHYQLSRKPYFLPLPDSDVAFSFVKRVNENRGETGYLPITINPETNGGWRFDPSSASQVVYNTITQPPRGSGCTSIEPKVDIYTAHFRVYANTNNSGTVECTVYPQVDLIREEFVENNSSMLSEKDPDRERVKKIQSDIKNGITGK